VANQGRLRSQESGTARENRGSDIVWPSRPPEPADPQDLVIDVHTHILNAWDIPLVPFLKKNKPVLSPIASLVGKIVRTGAPKSRGGDPHDEEFGSCLLDLRESSLPRATCTEEQAEKLFAQLLQDDSDLSEMVLAERSRGGGEERVNWATQGPRVIRFVSAFHRSRTHQARTLLTLYPDVHLFVPAMVDMDGWPGADAKMLSVEERLDALGTVMDVLNGAYPGVIHPYVSFNPLHGVEGLPEYVENYHEIIERALERDGFLGVKLYPGFGYLPLDNAKIPADAKHRPDHAERIDAELEWFYSYAERHGIPVMAHCSAKGAELGKRHSEIYGHPKNWERVLTSFPDLRVSLGHFGKAAELLRSKKSETSWPVVIGSMIGEHPNLYADLSLDGVPSEKRFRRMLENLKVLMDANPAIRTRLMYGTDWFMLLLDAGSVEYYERYDEQFTDDLLGEGMRRAFFGQSAVKFLGLDDPRTRKRLRTYYSSRDLTEPRWLADTSATGQATR
jgi:predicted TIM-barrel fold metal-dependent hydrolase